MKEKYFYREIPSISIVALIFMICIYSFWMVKTVNIMRSNSVLSATIVFYIISFLLLILFLTEMQIQMTFGRNREKYYTISRILEIGTTICTYTLGALVTAITAYVYMFMQERIKVFSGIFVVLALAIVIVLEQTIINVRIIGMDTQKRRYYRM